MESNMNFFELANYVKHGDIIECEYDGETYGVVYRRNKSYNLCKWWGLDTSQLLKADYRIGGLKKYRIRNTRLDGEANYLTYFPKTGKLEFSNLQLNVSPNEWKNVFTYDELSLLGRMIGIDVFQSEFDWIDVTEEMKEGEENENN